MSGLQTACSSPRGYATFGCLSPLPDFSGRSSVRDEVVTAAARYPLSDPFSQNVQQPSKILLLSAESPTPLVAFCVGSGRIRFYCLFNPLDRACRRLMQRSTEQGELQMLLWDREGRQLGLTLGGDLFADVLRSTRKHGAADLDSWIAHALSMAPQLPGAFAPQFPGIHDDGSLHCAVLMVTQDRLDHVRRTYWALSVT